MEEGENTNVSIFWKKQKMCAISLSLPLMVDGFKKTQTLFSPIPYTTNQVGNVALRVVGSTYSYIDCIIESNLFIPFEWLA